MATTREKISSRLREIDDEIERHDSRVRALKEEAAELLTTLRVMGRYGDDDRDAEGGDQDDLIARRQVTPRPEETPPEKTWKTIPPVTAMISEALTGLHMIDGQQPHPPQEIADFIRDTWGVEIDNKRIAQVASRLAKEGRIARVAVGKYAPLPQGQTTAAAPVQTTFEDMIG